MANFDLAMDLGSDFISVLTKNSDVLIKQYNYIALKNDDSNEILACGNGAVKLFTHNPQKVRLVRPIDECNIKNKEWVECYFNWLFSIINEEAFDNQRVRILCTVPCGINSNEKKQLETLFVDLGAKTVVFVEAPKACAMIFNQEYKADCGIIVDLGSCIADFGCVIDGELKNGCSFYLGGRQIDVGIKQFIETQYNMYIDLSEAEKIKKQCSLYENNVAQIFVEGTNYENKCLDKVEVPLRALYDVLSFYVGKYCGIIKSMLKMDDLAMVEKIKLGGIYLCGGLSKIEGIADFISKRTELNAKVSAYGQNSTIYGARLLLDEKIFK